MIGSYVLILVELLSIIQPRNALKEVQINIHRHYLNFQTHHCITFEHSLNIRDNKDREWHNANKNMHKLMRAKYTHTHTCARACEVDTYETFPFYKCTS